MDIKTEEIKDFFLADGTRFSYTIKQSEITNILGVTIAILDEYLIRGSAEENYKLYRTKEGNWYDLTDINNGVNTSVLLALKFGIDKD